MNTDRILTISANAPLVTAVSGNESTSVKSPKETISAFPKQCINYSQTAKVLLIKQGIPIPSERQINTLAVKIRRKFQGATPMIGKQGGKYILVEELIPLLLTPEFKGRLRRDALVNAIQKASHILEPLKP